MRLITGPPATGKTHAVLAEVRARITRRDFRFRLLAPTYTMAQHTRNVLAREGLVFPAGVVSTIAGFVQPLAGTSRQVSAAALELLAGDTVDRTRPPAFREVAALAGFRSAVARVIDELSAAGCDAVRFTGLLGGSVPPVLDALGAIYAGLSRSMSGVGLALRGDLLRQAASTARRQGLTAIDEVFLDGFFSFTGPELDLIEALSKHARVTVTLPAWPGAEAARSRLAAMGFREERLTDVRRAAPVTLIAARGQHDEISQIAARILDEARAGRPFRHMGVVVRATGSYAGALRAALERFGIPARFYFRDALADHPFVRAVEALMDALLSGWEHEATLAALRLLGGGSPVSTDFDRFDSAVRRRLPGSGFEDLLALAEAPSVRAAVRPLKALDGWLELTATPQEWASRFRELEERVALPQVAPMSHEAAAIWRGASAARAAYEAAIDEAAGLLPRDARLSLQEFWSALRDLLRRTPLRAPDHRRDVVHVMDVFEARQWELPVVFICGLLEGQFPMRQPADPILGETLRRQLRRSGVPLAGSEEWDRQERFLFELATTRASESLVLSYPQFDGKGNATVRSFLLERYLEGRSGVREATPRPVRPEPRGPMPPARRPLIYDEELRLSIRRKCARIGPTAVEQFLQCPFLFFTDSLLRLAEPPAPAGERLDERVQGTILHRAMARWLETREPAEALLERFFEEACAAECVPEGYRKESVRLELLRSLQRFLPKALIPAATPTRAESAFALPLDGETVLDCRVDRIDTLPDGRVVVIDYKHSAPDRLRGLIREHEEGRRIQGGAYLLAVEQAGLQPAGFLFAGTRLSPSWAGWHTLSEKPEGCAAVKPERLREIMEQSRQVALAALERIRQGEIAPQPADANLCQRCRRRDACRVESAEAALGAGESEP